jgi:signal transduction histidine kinase
LKSFCKFIILSDTILFAITCIILYYVSISLTKDIQVVTLKLNEIASNNKNTLDLSNSLSITSEDEISDLAIAFNSIQKLIKNNVETIQSKQSQLIEQERLASLGQMIGGIAHNLKTPIMSIAGATEALHDLTMELDNSIGNPVVTNEDFHDIAKDYNTWITKIKAYTEYMSDIITAVKGQAVNLSKDTEINFTIAELFKRVDILMKHELKSAIIYLNTKMLMDDQTIIKGDVNSLVQVINNMISNAIQAYNGKTEQTIELIAKIQNDNVIISVIDHASGLPEKVQESLFKEMITTKGKNGTGLGLYMSYSTIKAHFNGNITFETEEGKGTRFDVIIPL